MYDPDDTEERRRVTDREYYLDSFDPATEAASARLYRALEEMEGTDTGRLPPLGERIDPDALDALCSPRYGGEPRESLSHVRFEYGDHAVSVTSGGMIVVSKPAADGD